VRLQVGAFGHRRELRPRDCVPADKGDAPVTFLLASRRVHDYDWIVIGSGFGGSVSALRLAEKGHRVGVLEAGRRFADHELPRPTWDLRRYFWAPKLGMKGIFCLTIFKDVAVASGDAADMTKRAAISSSIYPDPDTHIETVTYGDAGDSMSAL
jgi:cholesterol oxidase